VILPRLSLPPASPLEGSCGISRRLQGVGFAVLAGLAVLQHQPGGGFLDAPAPIDGQQAEGIIRPIDVDPIAATDGGSILHAPAIARPPLWRGVGAAKAEPVEGLPSLRG
jgi:hypothetical protein